MKRFLTLLAILVCCGAVKGIAQLTATASIQNPRLNGDTLIFDIFLVNTSAEDFFLSDCSFSLDFASAKFSAPAAEFGLSSVFTTFPLYSPAGNVAGSIVGGEVFAPFPHTTTNTIQISSLGNGTHIGTIKLSGISDFTGDPGLAWNGFASVISWDPVANSASPANITFTPPPALECGPLFEAAIRNQQLIGSTYTFDVYLKRTGGQDYFLGDTEFILTFDDAGFTAPAISLSTSGTTTIAGNYTISPSIVTNQIQIDVDGPSSAGILTQTDFDTMVQQISTNGNGTLIGSFAISNANGTTAVADVDPQWVKGGSPLTVFRNRRDQTPWSFNDDVTDNGTCIIAPPVFSVELTAPNGGEIFTPGDTETISWNSSNVQNVQLDLFKDGALWFTITASHPAAGGSFSWAIPDTITPDSNYRVRVIDVADPGRFDDSNSDFIIDLSETEINVQVYMEGFWNGVSHVRTPISVELRTGAVLATSTFITEQPVMLDVTGNVTVTFSNLNPDDYWLVIRHGGHIPIASSSQITMGPGDTINYDFTDLASKAFGTNATKLSGSVFVVIAGDLNGDRNILINDVLLFAVPNVPAFNPGQVPAP